MTTPDPNQNPYDPRSQPGPQNPSDQPAAAASRRTLIRRRMRAAAPSRPYRPVCRRRCRRGRSNRTARPIRSTATARCHHIRAARFPVRSIRASRRIPRPAPVSGAVRPAASIRASAVPGAQYPARRTRRSRQYPGAQYPGQPYPDPYPSGPYGAGTPYGGQVAYPADPLVPHPGGGFSAWWNSLWSAFGRSWKQLLPIVALTSALPSILLAIVGVELLSRSFTVVDDGVTSDVTVHWGVFGAFLGLGVVLGIVALFAAAIGWSGIHVVGDPAGGRRAGLRRRRAGVRSTAMPPARRRCSSSSG